MTEHNHADPADQLEIFWGRMSPASAELYFRLRQQSWDPACRWEGEVEGPHTQVGHTLPATVAIRDLGAGPVPLAAVRIPDPCFWTPDLPAVYQVRLRFFRGESLAIEADCPIGLRFLGASGDSFRVNGSRWVLRGAFADHVPQGDLASWRAAHAAMVVRDPPESLCRHATEQGVRLVAVLDQGDPEWGRKLQRLPQFASVALVLVQGTRPLPDENLKLLAHPNLTLACPLDHPAAELADALVVDADELPRRLPELRGAAASPEDRRLARPVIAVSRLAAPQPLSEVRAAIDRLQARLAPHADLAGYLV